MEPENLKRKISQEIDSSADHDFSADVKSEMESNVELKKFADDVVKIESMLENVNEQTGRDFDPKPLMEKISKAVKDAGPGEEIQAEFLSEPMPETEEDKASDAPREQPAFTFPIIAASADAEPEKPPRRDEDFGRLTSRRMKAGAAEGESSGLINLGALVQEHRESQLPKAPPAAAPSPMSAAAQAPRPSTGRKFVYIALIALFAVVGIVAIVQIGLMSKHKADTGQASSSFDEKAMEEELKAQLMASMEKQKAGAVPAETQQPQEPALAAEEEGEASGEEATAGGEHPAKKKKKGGLAAPSSGGGAEGGKEEEETPEMEPTPKEKGQSDLLSLLDSATQKKEKAAGTENKTGTKSTVPDVEDLMGEKKPEAKQEEGGASDLPATLSKNQIRTVMQKLNPQIRKCGEGKVGNLILNLTVNNDGSVKSVKVTGEFANDPVGKCAEGVAKTAKFPPFKNPTMTVTYPYVFTPPPGV